MTPDVTLDVDFCRSHFPALESGWVFMENAGGTLVPNQVIERAQNYLTHHQVQPGEGYEASVAGAERIDEGRAALAATINADTDEIIVGPSTTSNVYVLSHALRDVLKPGDEVIVTNQDHEANNGAWRRLESTGAVIREWRMNADTDDLEIEDLEVLLNEKTKLVCFTHCSNIVGLIHDVKAIVARIHRAGALACVDGVAYTPHRRVDVKDLDVDFYLYSPYKVFGPHLGVLYGKREVLAKTTNENHYFIGEGDFQRSLCPGGLNFELTAASAGMAEYFVAVHDHHFPGANVGERERLGQVFELFANHESMLAERIENFLDTKPDVRLMGRGAAGRRERVGVFSFLVNAQNSQEIPAALREHKIGIYADDFYASRCIDALGARAQNGVVRVSLAHYNSAADVDRLIRHLDDAIPS
jgi:cysteine desulfurase family protein (TIGR01976 family)